MQKAYDLAAANAAKMREMHDKLVGDINDLNARKDAIKAKVAVAKTQERLNKLGSSIAGAQNSVSAFDKMEAKVDRMLDEANAMAEPVSYTHLSESVGVATWMPVGWVLNKNVSSEKEECALALLEFLTTEEAVNAYCTKTTPTGAFMLNGVCLLYTSRYGFFGINN